MQRTKSKILSILLSLVMLLSLLPTTALAAGTYHPKANEVSVDDGKYFAEPGAYHFRNGEKTCSKDPKGSNATYDPTTGTLTLDGYKGGSIMAGGTKSKITVVLVGENIIKNGSLTSAWGGDIIVTSSSGGTLSITNTLSGSNPATGIETGYGNIPTGNVTIEGSAKVTINTTHDGTSTYEKAYGIFARENITISGDASVDITCATPKNTTGGDYCNGLYAAQNVIINTNGTIMIDVTNAGKDKNNGYSFGVFTMGTATLTKVGNMEVNWKKVANNSNYPGGAFKGEASIASGTHAVNEDTTNCYASYRYSTSYYTVMVVNGQLTGPGVKYEKDSGKFLAGDTVSIKPGGKTSNDNTPIPFKEWIAEGVKLKSLATTADNSFPVPNKNVTVTAMHSPFVGAPSFTRESDSRGKIEFKTVAKPDNSEFFEYVKDGETAYKRPYSQPTTTSSASPYAYSVSVSTYYAGDIKNLEAGEYRMAVTLNNERYLSEPFTVNYTAPTADISVSGTIKSYGSASDAVTVTLTKQGETKPTFTDTPTGASGTAPYSQNYSFSAVPAGTYTLKVEKKGHAPWTEKITVGSADVTKDVTIYLIGDVNGDGAISVSDMQRLYAHLNGTKPLTDTSTADVNNDKVISVSDMQRLYAHLNGTKPLS